jgi:hypothetical protein
MKTLACSTQENGEMHSKFSLEILKERDHLGDQGKCSLKMDFTEIGYKYVCGIELAEDRVQCSELL